MFVNVDGGLNHGDRRHLSHPLINALRGNGPQESFSKVDMNILSKMEQVLVNSIGTRLNNLSKL